MLHSKTATFVLFFVMPLPGIAGFLFLADYSLRPGPATDILVDHLEEELRETSAEEECVPLVYLFYHPKCPCTRATARCLERLQIRFEQNPVIRAYAFRPQRESAGWIDTDSTRILKRCGAKILEDINGETSRQFGVRTSGHILVFIRGNLLFSGGITPCRAHEGDCNASDQFLGCVNGLAIKNSTWPVFGCSITAESEIDHD